ncbi:chlorophyll a/b-binding protein [Leptolyngbya sp. PCC 6406]|uniref:chlorophyll a/b-binding protein n=1 Tax=Leptolyngbya sp. PCC 6406 TaxID=1173264 RepID=UPI0002ACDFE2|nr:chlorophyll a/b-binding protein [Leptolyngbya sp. PCC 6406]
MTASDSEQHSIPEAPISPEPSVSPEETPASPVGAGTETETTPGFGWTAYAERINGRFAMVGFIALLVLEFFTRQDFFTWLGL